LFKSKYPSEAFDQALWKQFWFQTQQYHTLCLPCIADKRDKDRKVSEVKNSKQLGTRNVNDWGAVKLQDASKAIMMTWYQTASDNVFGANGRARQRTSVDISDDDEDDDFSYLWKHHPIDFASNTKSIAVFWLRTARAKIQRDNATFKNE